MKKTALITGISGQDGAYLAQFLLKKYKVIETDRIINKNKYWRLKKLKIINKILFKKMNFEN